MKNKFGEKNILQAIVHKDENRPHIHIVVIPTTRDEHGKEHLNFKGAFQRQDYKEMHPELERYTQERTKDKSIRLYDETKEKTKTVSKERYILQDELKKLDKIREELERKEKELQEEIEKQKEQEKKLEAKEKELQKKIKEHNKQVKEYNQEREKLKNAERQQEERKNYLEERKNFCKENGIKDFKYHQAVKDYERTGDPTFNFFNDKDGKQYLGYIDPEIINELLA
jgi:chromosome segregation ATPase